MVVNTSRKSVMERQVSRYQKPKYLEKFLTSGVAKPVKIETCTLTVQSLCSSVMR